MLAAATVAAFFAARALAPAGKSSAGEGSTAAAGANASQASAKPLPADPAEAIARVQAASLSECEALLADGRFFQLPTLVREAMLLRLSELDPRRLAKLLLGESGSRISSAENWLKWLARTHRDILDEELAAGALSAARKDFAERAISTAEAEERSDPRKTLEAALENGRHEQVLSALGKLAESDPHLALDYLELLLDKGQLPAFFDAGFLTKMAEADPTRLQALVGKLRTPEQSLAMAGVVARALAASDPAAAVAFYDSLPPSRTRSIAALDLVAVWARKDPEAALAWIQQRLPEGAVRRSALALTLAPLAATDPKRVLELLGQGAGSGLNDGSFNSYSTDFTTSSFGAGGAANTNTDGIRERAMLALVDSDPQAAFAILNQDLAARKGSNAFMHRDTYELAGKALAAWLGKDPAASIGWLDGLDDKTCSSIISGLSSSLRDLPAAQARQALASLGSFRDEDDAHNFMCALAPSLALADASAALATAETLPEKFRADWTSAVISEMAKSDPAAAAREVARLPEDKQGSVNLIIAGQMAASSPRDAIAYLDGLQPGARSDQAYEMVFSAWIGDHSQAALEWWRQLPDASAIRAATLPNAVGELYKADPSSMPQIIGMIAALPEEYERAQAVRNIAGIMVKTDRAAASALIADPALKLSADRQKMARVLSGLEDGR